jgi:hypothetical protein
MVTKRATGSGATGSGATGSEKPKKDPFAVAAVMCPAGLHQAKLAVMRAVSYIQKKQPDKSVPGGLRYSYASEEAIVQAIHDACLEAGLVVTPIKVKMKHLAVFTTNKGTPMNHAILLIRYRLTHAATGQSEEGEATGEAMDTGDKACNKATTGAFKYFLRQTFVIPTGDDPDAFDSRGMERQTDVPQPPPLKRIRDDSFERCQEALGRAPSIEALERYREAYLKRNYQPEQVEALNELYQQRKEHLQQQPATQAERSPPSASASQPPKLGENGKRSPATPNAADHAGADHAPKQTPAGKTSPQPHAPPQTK